MPSGLTKRPTRKSQSLNDDDNDNDNDTIITHSPLDNTNYKTLRRKRKRNSRKRRPTEPFVQLYAKVSITAVLLLVGLYILSYVPSALSYLFFLDNNIPQEGFGDDAALYEETQVEPEKSKSFPILELHVEQSMTDPWEMASYLENEIVLNNKKQSSFHEFVKTSQEIIQDFEYLYGGENAARGILQRALYTFSPTPPTPPTMSTRTTNTDATNSSTSTLSNSSLSSSSSSSSRAKAAIKQQRLLRKNKPNAHPKNNKNNKNHKNKPNNKPNKKSNPSLPFDSIPPGLIHTAKRILKTYHQSSTTSTTTQGEPEATFHISFSGSTTVRGEGNTYKQAYPTILSSILTIPFQNLGIELVVRNAAIKNIASFPYGWCLNNYLGVEANVVSWDVGMNGRQDSIGAFEGFLRNVMVMNLEEKEKPMVVVREASGIGTRRELLQKYVDIGALDDPILIDMEKATKPFLDLTDEITPPGFRNWLDFGGPEGAPGKTKSNLSRQQHEFIAWVLSMYLLNAAQLAVYWISTGLDETAIEELGTVPTTDDGDVASSTSTRSWKNRPNYILPPPFSPIHQDDAASKAQSFLLGIPTNNKDTNDTNNDKNKPNEWQMNPIHCRTSFDPIIGGDLQDMVLSGTAGEEVNLRLPKSPMFFNSHWVMDAGPEMKRMMRLEDQYKFGFQDLKKAYYGVKTSGILSLFVPYSLDYSFPEYYDQDEGGGEGGQVEGGEATTHDFTATTSPHSLFRNIIVCEVNEHRGGGQCNMEKDVEFIIGGAKANDVTYIDAMGTKYQGKKICVIMSIPQNTTLTTMGHMKKEADAIIVKESETIEEIQFMKNLRDEVNDRDNDDDTIGLSLQVSVLNPKVSWDNGPCSVSHVIWEQVRLNKA